MIWLNGKFTDNPAAIAADNRGLLLGDGVFETMLAEKSQVHFLPEHFARLCASLRQLHMPLSYDLDTITDACAVLVAGEHPRMVLRLTVSRTGGRGLHINPDQPASWLLTAQAAAPVPQTLNAVTTPLIRPAANPTSHMKTISQLDNILARAHATRAHADEGLMLNEHGRLACAAAGNIFIQNGNTLLTPPESEGALGGIIRHAILTRAEKIGLTARTAPITPDALKTAAHIFVTNSLIGAVPVTQLDGHPKPPAADMKKITGLVTP